MAPAMPLTPETEDTARRLFDQAWATGISCGLYCGYAALVASGESPIDRLLAGQNIRVLLYGPAELSRFAEVIDRLRLIAAGVWTLSDGVCPEVVAAATTGFVSTQELERAYQDWLAGLTSR